jgi:hypothetical protein
MQEVINAVQTALDVDEVAGLRNNLKKFVAMSTSTEARRVLSSTLFHGKCIRVALEDVLVGFNVSVRRATRRARQDERISESIKIASRAAASGVGTELKRRGYGGSDRNAAWHAMDAAFKYSSALRTYCGNWGCLWPKTVHALS